jgi:hypothetical protein
VMDVMKRPGLSVGRGSNYHDASDVAELVVDISTGADNWATHLVTSGGNRAATFEMILIVSKIGVSNRNWHSRCSDLFAYTKSATNVFTKRRL